MAANHVDSPDVTPDELALAARNAGMPLEALRWDVTPVGLHYLLIHYDIPAIDPAAWRLRVGGRVARPLALSLDDLRARPSVTRQVTMECAGNGRARLRPRAFSQPWLHEAVGNGAWTGTPLAALLAEADVDEDAVDVVFTGADRGVEGGDEQPYARSLSRAEALSGDALLVWGLNDGPLPPQHGFPVRLLVPGWYGMASVKWLTSIEAIDRPFDGYQQVRAYRWRRDGDDPGEPLSRMAVRALMAPPGVPGFPVRRRFLAQEPCTLTGRAWSGAGPVTTVEVSTDGGTTWTAATLDQPADPYAWAAWRTTWTPPGPGDYELCCRATDTTGATQPESPVWNVGGYAVNAIQRIPVTVR